MLAQFIKIATLSLLVGAPPLRAESADFHSLFRSPYYLGRGDTGVSTADNHEAIFYNPAGLAQGQGIYKETVLASPSFSVSTKTKDLVRQVLIQESNDPETFRSFLGRNLHLSFSNFSGVVFRRAALGILVSSKTSIMLAKSAENRGLETLHAEAAANRVLVFSAAEAFLGGRLMVGATGKYMMRNEASLDVSVSDSGDISDQLSADDVTASRNGLGLDVGFMYLPEKSPWRVGLQIENLGTTLLKTREEGFSDKRLPQIINLGAAYDMRTKMSSMLVQADFRDASGSLEKDVFKRLHLGSELQLMRVFGLLAGINQGYPTIGTFMNLYFARIDLGVYTEEVGGTAGVRADQRLYVRLKAGF